jgi:hypothetical protein
MDALVRVVTVLVLLAVRRKGPGLWWSVVCVALALAVLPLPFPGGDRPLLLLIGGLGGPGYPGSQPWGFLFLAIELLCLFRAFDQGRTRALYALVPLFLLWANVDELFLFGLIVLAAAVAGLAIPSASKSKDDAPPRPSLKAGLIALAACLAACLVNPSFWRIYPAALGSILPLPGWSPGPLQPGETSFFRALLTGKPSREDVLLVFYLAFVSAGLASFALNRRRFSWPRFLAFVAAALLWAVVSGFSTPFFMVLAVVLTLNGQEWYQDRFGTAGHLGRGWAVWSTGGRAATFAALGLVLVLRVILGWGAETGEARFGFGFDPGAFAFEAAETLRDAPIEGNVLNYMPGEGDALAWRAYPKRKVFIDSRRHLYGEDLVARYDAIRRAVRDDEVETWKPLLDEYGVSAVMVDTARSQNTYRSLSGSRNWIRFYDDGDHALFGRADAKAEDLAYFRKREMNVENLAYKNPSPAPFNDKLPQSSELESIYHNRRAQANSHTVAAMRWLRPSDIAPNTPYMPDPGRCFLAIRDARRALVANINEAAAYIQLADAYATLLGEESALIAGIELTPANVPVIGQINPQLSLLAHRYRQLVTALHYAVLTTPPPQTTEEKRELARLNLRLSQVYSTQGTLDLARDSLDAWQRLADPADYPPDQYTALVRQLTGLNKHLEDVQRAVTNLGIETQAGPLQKAALARQSGAVGLAIQQLEEALQAGVNPALIKPALLDLYCQVGEPDKAGELWQSGNYADPVLSDGPGTAAMRQGRVFFLLGNYDSALAVWTREAIRSIRGERTLSAPLALRAMLDGDATAATRALLAIPEEVNKQAMWEFEIGMASLEAGHPVDQTAEHLTNALKLAPNLAVRPVIAYYLKKLGRPVPEPPTEAKKDEAKPEEAKKTESKPEEAKKAEGKPEDAKKAEAKPTGGDTKPAEPAATPK